MLEFFRKYQRYFFWVIAIAVIASFLFFGASSAITGSASREDRVVGRAVDGSEVSFSELASLARFIAQDLGDGVIRKDFLGSGIGEILVRDHFDLFKKEFEQKIQRIKTYRAYEHPEAPFLSAKAVWQRFAPEINREWSILQSMDETKADVFGHLARLYYFQNAFPPEQLRQVLLVHEQQYRQWLRPDPRLRQDDLSLFGFHSAVDWFGKNFVDLVAVFIHNAAIEAQRKGYAVTLEEAKGDLARILQEKSQVPYNEQLKTMGLEESQAASVWRKVLLMRRYFSDRGHSVFLDRLPYAEFSTLASEEALVDCYETPSALKMKNSLNLFSFQTYVDAIAPQNLNDRLALPQTLFPLAEIEKRCPELVATMYRAKVYAIDKREVALRAPMQEVWAFETEDGVWKRLCSEFSFLHLLAGKPEEERFVSLNALEPVNRAKVDQFARQLLVDRHPEWVEQALSASAGEEKDLSLCAGKINFPHIDDCERLGTLFQQILTSPESALAELYQFTSRSVVLRFENIEQIGGAKVKTFEEALRDGSMGSIVDRALHAAFPKARFELPPALVEKELADVKEEVAAILLKGLQRELETVELQGEGPDVARRFALLALRAQRELQQGESQWVCVEGEDPLLAQFKLRRTQKQVHRTAEEAWMAKEAFLLADHQWSPVHIDLDGGVSFIYLKSRHAVSEPILEQLSVGHEILAADVQRLIAEQLLKSMQQQQAVLIPLQSE